MPILFLSIAVLVLLGFLLNTIVQSQKRETAIMNMLVALHQNELGNKQPLIAARQECFAAISEEGVEDVRNIIKNGK